MSDAPSTPAAPATAQASDSLEVIRKFAETYAQRTGTYFCSDPGVTAVVLEGLARHKDDLGGALCPCRHYEDKQAEVAQAFWNFTCVPVRARKDCHGLRAAFNPLPLPDDVPRVAGGGWCLTVGSWVRL